MSAKPQGFGFRPEESEHHFVVTVPGGSRGDVLIAEHLSFDPATGHAPPSLGVGVQDVKLRVALPRAKWTAVADEVRVEFNRRLRKQGQPPGRWKRGDTPVTRLLGKEVTLLAWAVEDADPALVPAAVKNWLGLAPEERWWLFTMTNAATGHALHGRNKGWRKAVRFALTENPVIGDRQERQSEIFRLVAGEERAEPSRRGGGSRNGSREDAAAHSPRAATGGRPPRRGRSRSQEDDAPRRTAGASRRYGERGEEAAAAPPKAAAVGGGA